MALKFQTPWVSTNRPGAYIKSSVKSTPVGAGDTGVIVIIGEAAGGPDFASEANIADNFFTADQADAVASKYLSGHIVDAMNALAVPSNDTDITGSPGRVVILKTNAGTKATASIPAYATASDLNYGTDGNKYSFRIVETQAEIAPSVTSDDLSVAMATPAVFDSLNFAVRLQGGAVVPVTLSNTTADHDTMSELAAEIDGMLPAGMSCVADGNQLVIAMDADPAAASKGFGKSFELIDSTPGDLAVIGLDAGVVVSASESEVELNIVRTDIDANELFAISAAPLLEIGYEGTTATMTINATGLTTTVVGGAGGNLAIQFSDFPTVATLAAFIESQTGYTARFDITQSNRSPLDLDKVVALGIAGSAGEAPGRVKAGVANFKSAVETSQHMEFAVSATQGLPAAMGWTYLSGGAKGGTSGAKFLEALTACEGISTNFIVPLFSRDASADIVDGLTDASSTYTIDAIHASVKNHDLKMSQVKMKKNRQGFLAFDGTFAEAKVKAATLANYRHALAFQKVQQVDSFGAVKVFPGWMEAILAAGMQAAGFYQSLVNKYANGISFVDPSGFNSGKPGDVEEAISAGLLFLERDADGIKWVSDQTTYGFDTNFVYNSIQAVYCKDIVELDLCASIERAFVGKSLADVEIATVLAFISAKMDEYKRLKLIAESDDAAAGYRNVDIKIDGPFMFIKLEIKLATSLYFVGIEMEVSQVKRSGSQA